MQELTCFRAYDVRGKLGVEIDPDICERIAQAFAIVLNTKKVVVGYDARESSPEIANKVMIGLNKQGVEVLNLGMCGTEEVYWATTQFGACGGIEITASHNPIEYNGLKMVKANSVPLDPKTEFAEIKTLAEKNEFVEKKRSSKIIAIGSQARDYYTDRVISFVDIKKLPKIKVLVNSGNGAAGPTIKFITKRLSELGCRTEFVLLNENPDGSFPNGIPNPLVKENQDQTRDAILSHKADIGLAFDGDFDRCFFFDHKGNFIEGEFIIGLLASIFLEKDKKSKIVHDRRVIWNVQEAIKEKDGISIVCNTGHNYVKAALREHNAIYGGELSAHHYFKDFAFCDSGMIPWLVVLEHIGKTNITLFDLVQSRRQKFASSGELNFKVKDIAATFEKVFKKYGEKAKNIERVDGISLAYENWRFNLRASNTEPVVRLNIESMGDIQLISEKVQEITGFIHSERI